MALDSAPNFRVNVYGSNPTALEDIERDMVFGGPSSGNGGGLPWFRTTPSPTYPSNTSTSQRSENTVAQQQPPTFGSRLDAAGQGLSGAAGGAANERDRRMMALSEKNRNALTQWQVEQNAALEALIASGRDKMTGYGTQQNATSNMFANRSAENIQRARLGLDAPSARARQSVLGSLMKNLQPTSIEGPAGQRGHETKISGGLSASALDPMTRQQGQALLQQALEAQLSGSDVPAASDWQSSVLNVPEATDYTKGLKVAPQLEDTYQKPGKLESILGMLGFGLRTAGGLAGIGGR